eukprot:m.308898 g.308898  ORF g.308898 m.308898 type:complete len:257 (+) comp45013_c0_seq1:153-923(+)
MEQGFDVAKIDEMKRSSLQKLCKSLGLKANGKNTEMKERLREHYQLTIEVKKSPEKSAVLKRKASSPGSEAKRRKPDEEAVEMIESRRKTYSVSPKKPKPAAKNKAGSKIPRFTGKGGGKKVRFDDLHRKAFDRMESLDDYAKRKEERRKQLTSTTPKTKTKTPDFKSPGFSFKSPMMSPFAFSSLSNADSSAKPKFDLKASLAKALSYQPHKGILQRSDPKERKIDIKQKMRDERMKAQKGKRENARQKGRFLKN